MSTEVSRKDYGMTDKGGVVVIETNNSDDQGNDVLSYQVRHGVHTVAEGVSKQKAEAIAKALVMP